MASEIVLTHPFLRPGASPLGAAEQRRRTLSRTASWALVALLHVVFFFTFVLGIRPFDMRNRTLVETILTMPQYCAVGSTGAAALRTAVRRAREIGGGGLVAASPGALGTADGDTAKSSTERRPGSVRPTQVGAP